MFDVALYMKSEVLYTSLACAFLVCNRQSLQLVLSNFWSLPTFRFFFWQCVGLQGGAFSAILPVYVCMCVSLKIQNRLAFVLVGPLEHSQETLSDLSVYMWFLFYNMLLLCERITKNVIRELHDINTLTLNTFFRELQWFSIAISYILSFSPYSGQSSKTLHSTFPKCNLVATLTYVTY